MNILKSKWLILLLCLPLMTSCWKELPAYEDAEITKVGFYHRFPGPDKDPVTGEQIVVEKELNCTYDIDTESATVQVDVVVPSANGSFTEQERNKVSQSKLWGYVNVSTAAMVTPIEDSPKLGTPGDWTKPRKYQVTAANGNTKIWTIIVRSFTK